MTKNVLKMKSTTVEDMQLRTCDELHKDIPSALGVSWVDGASVSWTQNASTDPRVRRVARDVE